MFLYRHSYVTTSTQQVTQQQVWRTTAGAGLTWWTRSVPSGTRRSCGTETCCCSGSLSLPVSLSAAFTLDQNHVWSCFCTINTTGPSRAHGPPSGSQDTWQNMCYFTLKHHFVLFYWILSMPFKKKRKKKEKHKQNISIRPHLALCTSAQHGAPFTPVLCSVLYPEVLLEPISCQSAAGRGSDDSPVRLYIFFF